MLLQLNVGLEDITVVNGNSFLIPIRYKLKANRVLEYGLKLPTHKATAFKQKSLISGVSLSEKIYINKGSPLSR